MVPYTLHATCRRTCIRYACIYTNTLGIFIDIRSKYHYIIHDHDQFINRYIASQQEVRAPQARATYCKYTPSESRVQCMHSNNRN